MPGRNIVKVYDSNSYYHVYNRGVEKRVIFIDEQDYSVFIGLLKRYFDIPSEKGSRGRPYINLEGEVEVVAFCLMPNHFHMLLYQIELGSVTKLMRAVCSSYSTYFNNKYDRVGSLFQGSFRAILVNNDNYLQYLSRYIHRNPEDYLNWKWSSLPYWLGYKTSFWLKPHRLIDTSKKRYYDYVADDDDYIASVEEISNIIF
jgi:putative transposase